MADERIGSTVGNYRLEALIGAGGFGSVWRGTDLRTGSTVAVKLLTGTYSTGETARQRADIELLASAATSSAHVVRVLDGGTDPVPFIAMEFVDGTDLASILKTRGKLPVEETLPIAMALADALESLYEAGIIHRDLKPANVMIARDGTVKLTDFGIAKIVGYESVTATGQLPMSMAYAAPEVWEGKPSHQSDLYAFGILVYQCLVGEPPFTGTFAEIYRKHLGTTPNLDLVPAETPQSLRSLLAECLAKETARRPASASQCKSLLEAARSELKAGVSPTRGPAEWEPPVQFGPWTRISNHPTERWAWRCRNQETGEEATVEVISSDEIGLGDRLRAAVSANPQLVPFGAERLLGTNRVILRPSEAWPDRPSGKFQFWLAREDPAAAPANVISATAVRVHLERIARLRSLATSMGVPVSAEPGRLRILGDDRLIVIGPGVPSASGGKSAREWLEEHCVESPGPALVEEAEAVLHGGNWDLGNRPPGPWAPGMATAADSVIAGTPEAIGDHSILGQSLSRIASAPTVQAQSPEPSVETGNPVHVPAAQPTSRHPNRRLLTLVGMGLGSVLAVGVVVVVLLWPGGSGGAQVKSASDTHSATAATSGASSARAAQTVQTANAGSATLVEETPAPGSSATSSPSSNSGTGPAPSSSERNTAAPVAPTATLGITSTPVAPPIATPTSSTSVLYDDFSDASRGIVLTRSSADDSVQYINGELVQEKHNPPNGGTQAQIRGSYSDVEVTAKVRIIESYGDSITVSLQCRAGGAGKLYFGALDPAHSTASIVRGNGNNSWTTLAQSTSVQTNTDPYGYNLLALRCIGDTITFRVNSSPVLTAQDSTVARGVSYLAFWVVRPDPSVSFSGKVAFDDLQFRILKP